MNVTVTITEIVDGVSAESTPTSITVFDGVSSGGGGSGAVDSVNGHTGVVVLAASDVGADASGAAAAAQAASQPVDSDLTAIAALSTTAFGRALLTMADAAATRTAIGAGTSSFDGAYSSLTGKPTLGTAAAAATTDFDASGAAAAAQAASQPLDSDLTAIAALTTTTFGRSLLTAADAAAARALAGAGTSSLVIGTTSSTAKAGDYQPAAANISDATAIGRTILTAATAAAVRTAIGLATVAATGAYTDLTGTPTLGTAAAKDIPATGNASATQVVYGSDTRLSDSRTPAAHASTHASGGSDPVTLAESQVTNLTTDLAAKAPLASPTFTGTPAAPTATAGTNTTQVATTAFVTTAVAGGSGGASTSACRVTKSGTQTLTHNTTTAVLFDAEDFDDASYHDTATNTSRFTAPATGRYRFTAGFGVLSARIVFFNARKNGTTTIAYAPGLTMAAPSGGTPVDGQCLAIVDTGVVSLTSGDYLELCVQPFRQAGSGDAQRDTGVPAWATFERIT